MAEDGQARTPSRAIETPRLTLRPHARADFDDSLALWSDPQVVRFIGGKPATREDVWARLLRYAGHWDLLGYGYWVVRERQNEGGGGRFLGEVGFADFHRELEPSFGDAPEIGWALTPDAQGRGFASEAVAAALAWGEAHFGAGLRTVCMISPENAPSLRVAAKLGFRAFADTAYKGAPTRLFERTAV